MLSSSSLDAVETLLATRQELLLKLKNRLEKAQVAMKVHVDSKRHDVSFKVGDWVYVKLRPYCQSSVSGAAYHKLSKCFYGPSQVTERIGAVAYRLNLPLTSKIHPVFHYSLLKLHQGPLTHVINPLPPDVHDNHPLVEPLAILDGKWDNSTSTPHC